MDGFRGGNIIFSLDIGTRSIKGTVLKVIDDKLEIIAEEYLEHKERSMQDGQIHNIHLVSQSVALVKKNLETKIGFSLKSVAIAAAGRFLTTIESYAELDIPEDFAIDNSFMKTLELKAIKDAEEKIIKNSTQSLYCVGYTVKNYMLNGYTISNLLSHRGKIAAINVIVTFLPSSVIDSLYAVMDMVDLKVTTLTLEPIAAMEAVIPPNLRILNLALVDIGAGTSDIAISSNDTLVGYGMVPVAGDEVTEVISKGFLLDFNNGELLKKNFSNNDELTYTDVLGFQYTADPMEVKTLIEPIIENMTSEIAREIISLNGDKSPSAVFLIGGGAHTPMLKDMLSKKLNLPPQRIAIKGREAVTQCISSDISLGSIGVTVLGIALIALRNQENNYIEVMFNDKNISLFNFKEYKVMDILVKLGINPRLLLGKKGEDLYFSINDVNYKIIGEPPSNATIYINNIISSLDCSISDKDSIRIDYAKDGNHGSAKLYEYLDDFNSIDFYIDNKLYTIEPIASINNSKIPLDYTIKNDDDIEVVMNSTLGEFLYSNNILFNNCRYYCNGVLLTTDYVIKNNDIITTFSESSMDEIACNSYDNEKKNTFYNISDSNLSLNNLSSNCISIKVTVNDKTVNLYNKSTYIFIDIFDFIDFDRSESKGRLILKHNGIEASYYEPLRNNDTIEIYWK